MSEARSPSRNFRRALLLLTGTGALLLLGYVFRHRVELIQVPLLWRQARQQWALRETDSGNPAFQPSLHWGLSPFDFTICRLIRLQRPEFLGGRSYTLEAVRTREGGRAFIAHFEPLKVPFDKEPNPAEEVGETFYFCPVVLRELVVLGLRGRVLGQPLTREVKDDPLPFRVLREPWEAFDLFRARVFCSGGGMEEEFTVDREGLASHGRVTEGELQAPLEQGGRPPSPPEDLERLERLLDSPHVGDLHRALTILEGSDGRQVYLVEPLLDHDESAVRAHAATVLVKDPSLARLALPLLKDPSARVRFAALHAIKGLPGWEQAMLPVLEDKRPEIIQAAHHLLVESEREEIALSSAIHLATERDVSFVSGDCTRFRSREFSETLLTWLEMVPEEQVPGALEFNILNGTPVDLLVELLPRITSFYKACDPTGSRLEELVVTLSAMDDPLRKEPILSALSPELRLSICEREQAREEY